MVISIDIAGLKDIMVISVPQTRSPFTTWFSQAVCSFDSQHERTLGEKRSSSLKSGIG